MYIEKDLQKPLVNNLNPGVCYVCGSPNSATHPLRTKPITTEPHFPFLEHHEPPIGCEVPRSNGVVVVCYVCYRFLIAQWDSHERNNTPHSTRLYWLKRMDQGPYSGSDGPSEERQIEASPHSGTSKIQEPNSTAGKNLWVLSSEIKGRFVISLTTRYRFVYLESITKLTNLVISSSTRCLQFSQTSKIPIAR